jgi:hypothetical protein
MPDEEIPETIAFRVITGIDLLYGTLVACDCQGDPSDAGVAELRDDDVRNAETNVAREKIHSGGIIDSIAHQRPAFPATISSASCPIIVNESLSIDGQDFGVRQGTVIVAFSDRSFSCEIEEWTDTNLRCHLPDEMIMAFGSSPEEAVIWLRPARVVQKHNPSFQAASR